MPIRERTQPEDNDDGEPVEPDLPSTRVVAEFSGEPFFLEAAGSCEPLSDGLEKFSRQKEDERAEDFQEVKTADNVKIVAYARFEPRDFFWTVNLRSLFE